MRRTLTAAIFVLSLYLSTAFGQTITPSDAAKHVGEQATVCGRIASERIASQSQGKPTFINLDRAYPDQLFTIVVWDSDRANVGSVPSSGGMCVTGKITLYRGVPEIVLHDAKDWSRLK